MFPQSRRPMMRTNRDHLTDERLLPSMPIVDQLHSTVKSV